MIHNTKASRRKKILLQQVHVTYCPGKIKIASGAMTTCPSPQTKHPPGGGVAWPDAVAAMKLARTAERSIIVDRIVGSHFQQDQRDLSAKGGGSYTGPPLYRQCCMWYRYGWLKTFIVTYSSRQPSGSPYESRPILEVVDANGLHLHVGMQYTVMRVNLIYIEYSTLNDYYC